MVEQSDRAEMNSENVKLQALNLTLLAENERLEKLQERFWRWPSGDEAEPWESDYMNYWDRNFGETYEPSEQYDIYCVSGNVDSSHISDALWAVHVAADVKNWKTFAQFMWKEVKEGTYHDVFGMLSPLLDEEIFVYNPKYNSLEELLEAQGHRPEPEGLLRYVISREHLDPLIFVRGTDPLLNWLTTVRGI